MHPASRGVNAPRRGADAPPPHRAPMWGEVSQEPALPRRAGFDLPSRWDRLIGGPRRMERALHMMLKPEWEAISSAWIPCEHHLGGHGLHHDEAYGLCMVVRELLENAVKYGEYAGAAPVIEVTVEVTPREVAVEVKNPVGPGSEHLREFDRTIQWIRGYQDPFEAYVERLKIASARAWGSGKSGLGLTRVVYEGRCALDFYVDASNTLAVSAVRTR